MYRLVGLVALFVIMRCGVKTAENELQLFNDISFQLLKNEKNIVLDSSVKAIYTKHIAKTKLQIPLFKCVTSSSYKLYLGIPFNLAIPRLKEGLKDFKGKDSLEYTTDSSSFIFARYKQDSTYVLEYAKNFNNNVVYIYGITQNKTLRDSIFNLQAISNRFKLSSVK